MGRLRRYLGEMRALNAIPSVRRQPTLDMLHRTLLSGLSFGNSDPVRNGELSIARELLAEFPGRSRVVFDVGASRGEYTAMLLERVESNLEVYCFEPSRVAFAELTERLGLSRRVGVANIGLRD